MTTRRLDRIRLRREYLLARAELQRLDLALYAQALQKPLALVDRGIALIRRVREHPAILLLGLAALVFLNRKRPGRMLYFGGMAWRVWQGLAHKKSKNL